MEALKESKILLLVFCTTFWLIISVCCAQECDYRYTRQPPTELDCNPYGTIDRLALTCSVEGPNTPQFSIIWFRITSNGAEELPDSLQRVEINVEASSVAGGANQFTRRSSRFALNGVDQVNDIGEYWCQVRLENGTVFQEKSNILVLYNEAHYEGLGQCSGSRVVDQRDCLHTLQITDPFTTDRSVPTDSVQPISEHLTTIEKPENSSKDIPRALLGAIAAVIFFFIIILLLIIAILALLRHKLKANNIQDEGSDQHELPEIMAESLVTQTTAFAYQNNVAYNKVCKVSLNENVSYAATTLPHELETSPLSQNAAVVCQYNVAYGKVNEVIPIKNKAYAATTPLRPPTPPEYEHIV